MRAENRVANKKQASVSPLALVVVKEASTRKRTCPAINTARKGQKRARFV